MSRFRLIVWTWVRVPAAPLKRNINGNVGVFLCSAYIYIHGHQQNLQFI